MPQRAASTAQVNDLSKQNQMSCSLEVVCTWVQECYMLCLWWSQSGIILASCTVLMLDVAVLNPRASCSWWCRCMQSPAFWKKRRYTWHIHEQIMHSVLCNTSLHIHMSTLCTLYNTILHWHSSLTTSRMIKFPSLWSEYMCLPWPRDLRAISLVKLRAIFVVSNNWDLRAISLANLFRFSSTSWIVILINLSSLSYHLKGVYHCFP